MIYLFEGYDEVSEEALSQLMDKLPPARKEKAEHFRYAHGKLTCTIAYLLFLYGYRNEFGRMDTPDFAIGEDEKPYLADCKNIHFNLSHCSRAVACMLSRTPVGIDVQEAREVKEIFLKRVCSEAEAQSIMSAPHPKSEFAKIWTQKEAISKYTGEGIFRDASAVSVDSLPPNLMAVTVKLQPEVYLTACGEVEDADFTMRKISLKELLELR